LTPFLGFVHLCLIQESHIFKWADPKNWPSTHHQIFRVCRGHKVGHNDTVLREFDEGILRGEGGKKNFLPPVSPPWGSGSTEIFLRERGRQAPCPDKILGHRIYTGAGATPKEISPLLGVAGGDEQISDPLGNRNLFFCARHFRNDFACSCRG